MNHFFLLVTISTEICGTNPTDPTDPTDPTGRTYQDHVVLNLLKFTGTSRILHVNNWPFSSFDRGRARVRVTK
eukprot:SAG11_NODE_423_length_9596_cov_4.427293_6_plen_73_part_00